jgi:predicted ATP-grasp superfamily ATP-dependent carboligase
MRVLLYEWCCSGGLAGRDLTIASEGRMMVESIATDAAKDKSVEIAVLVDAAIELALPPQAHMIPVRGGHDMGTLVAAARDADWTIIVAPENDGILLERVRRIRAAGRRVLAPQDRVIGLCSDKQATIDALAGRGVPVPAGRALAPRESIPAGFHMPAMRKARDGCGGDNLQVIMAHEATPAAGSTRLEATAKGMPVGISVLCGPSGHVPLPPMKQRFSSGDSPRYLGSDLLLDSEAAARATGLATRVAHAVEADCGWIGIDLVLGERSDGRDDRVLEVNPRMTTSIVGQTALFASSLVVAMIDTAEGRRPSLVKVSPTEPGAGSFSVGTN